MNRVCRNGKSRTTTTENISEEEVRSNQPLTIHTQGDAIAPPSSTPGDIDGINWSQQTRTNK